MKVLIVDNDIIWSRALARGLQALGHACRTCATAEEAERALGRERFTLMVTDVDLGGAYDGLDLAWWAYNGLRLEVVVVTDGDETWVSAGVLAMGAPHIPVVSKGNPTVDVVARLIALRHAGAPAHPHNDNGRKLKVGADG